MPGLPWDSSVRIPCCPGQTSGVATFGSVAVADVVVAAAVGVALVAAGHIVTWHATATTATVEAEEVATFGSKGSHHRMASDDAAGQGPCSSMVSFGAFDQKALVVAWLRPEMPSGSAGWGSRSMTGASSGSWGVT